MPSNPLTVVEVADAKVSNDTVKPNALLVWWSTQWRAILAELIATSLLVLFGCMSCIPIEGLLQQSPLYPVLGFGFTVLFNIQIFGHISGAHMNPVVTLAAVVWGSCSVALAVCYVTVQCLGAFIGYGILVALSPINLSPDGVCVTLPHQGLTQFQALGIEILLTSVLVFVCCGLWDPVNENKQDSVPIKFALTIAGLSVAGGPLTGASMNPVRSLGPSLWTGVWTAHWVYWVGPFIGGFLAVLIYKFIFLKRRK